MEITSKQFMTFRDLVYKESGINLHEGKEKLLTGRLSKRLKNTGIDSVEEYLKMLKSDKEELMLFLDAISTNHTFFFRERHHFAYLKSGQSNNIWCSAASSGEEPYSIAIDCLEKGFKPTILATDISTNVLMIGERAIYPLERIKDVPPHILKKYFQNGHGRWAGHVRLKDEVKRMVTFKRLNLVSDALPNQQFDIIFCRNVMIYFDNIVKEMLTNRLYNVLTLNGYLIVGGAESLSNLKHKYKYISPSIYKKVSI
jgi:chemotaxis protein methyltransferase CheR